MSECKWCDECNQPFPDSDVDSRALQVPVPKIENGVKVGISHTIERHQCGRCVRAEAKRAERRQQATLEPARDAPDESWGAS